MEKRNLTCIGCPMGCALLIKSQDNKEIKRILNKYKLESNQRRKVNTIRKNAGLEEIDVKTLEGLELRRFGVTSKRFEL